MKSLRLLLTLSATVLLLNTSIHAATTTTSSSDHHHEMTEDNSMADMPGMDMGDTSTSSAAASTTNTMTMSDMMTMSDTMHTNFNANWSQQTVLFTQWKTSNSALYILSLLVLFALSVAHEVLTVAQTRYDERVYKQRKQALDRRATEKARLLNDAKFAEKQVQFKEETRLLNEKQKQLITLTHRSSGGSEDEEMKSCCGSEDEEMKSCCGSPVLNSAATTELMSINRMSLTNPTDNKDMSTKAHSLHSLSNSQVQRAVSSTLNLIVDDNKQSNCCNSSSSADDLRKSLQFASEHLKQQRPLHCQTRIATVSSPMAGSSILTLSTSSCATPSTLYFRYTRQQQFIRTLFYLFRTFLMFVLMVLFMTLDVGFVAAILTGMCVGYFLFSNQAGTSVSIHH